MAYDKARSDELAIMSDAASAVPELRRRLAEWLVTRDGTVYLTEGSEKNPQIYAMPATTPWLLSCSSSGVKITIGGWIDIDEGSGGATFERNLTRARLSGDQCKTLLPLLSAAVRKNDFSSHDNAATLSPSALPR